ncbi:peptidase [Streptomyces sp. Ru73]|uniref:PepSY-associated TM helix domain-containing protein n=1 Tax=Streptomyces sp. Ru73 TaxID=2080748 RepID=UPI000CDD201C|nr:PepSY domain-containing protein [Streptomyces sp. Ru73]POX38042.1 peptidase [Streptomyces sp. Ru73]
MPLTTASRTPGEDQEDPAGRPPAGRSVRSALRPLVLRLHFYAGVCVAPFLLVAAVTGLLYACSFQAEKVVYAHELRVPVGTSELPVARQVAAARTAHPEGKVSAVRPSPEPGATTRVLLSGVPGVASGHTLAVFVNPYTAEVRGALEQYGSTGALPLRTWIDEFHRDLHLGGVGRLYSEFAASWLWVITGGGLLLWCGRRRSQRRVRGVSGRRRALSLHGAVGVWAAAGLFFLSATGLTWSAYAGAHISDLRDALGQATPAVSAAAAPGGEHAGHDMSAGHGGHGGHDMRNMPMHGGGTGGDVGLDAVLKAARGEGLSDPVEIVPPAGDSSAYVVQQIGRSWPEKQDAVAVDPGSGEVTDVVRFADYPVLAKLTRWGVDAHTGTLFGLVNQVVLAALALALVVLILLGYRMWWQRGRGTAFGRPVPRGAWRNVPLRLGLPLAAAVAVLGWFVPLLGIPLVVFLVADIALGAVARRSARGDRGASAAAG